MKMVSNGDSREHNRDGTNRPTHQNTEYLYPESTLSDKQLAALDKVIHPSEEQDFELPDTKKMAMLAPSDAEIKDRSLVKTVFLVIFLIIVVLAAGLAGFYYWWTTYSTFEYSLRSVAILEGRTVTPNDFLEPGEEMADISAVFQDPGFKPTEGLHFVQIILTKDLRTTEATAILYVVTPIEYYQHEFTEAGVGLRPIEFLSNADILRDVDFELHFTEEPLPLEEYLVGEYPIHLAFDDVPFEVMMHVVDTTPPTAATVDKTIQIGQEVSPEDFVTEIFDASPIASITFLEEPDVYARNDITVKVVITDVFGNEGVFTANLLIQLNQAPPVIEGSKNIDSEVGTPVLYLQGVTAHDDFGNELEVQVDNSGVDENSEGAYKAIYWAEDFSGNRAQVEVTVYVIGADPEYVNQRVGDILAGLINDNMTQLEKARAIHNWVRQNASPATIENGSQSIVAEAYRILNERRGDSRTYSAISELMLTRAGVPNRRIERIPGAAKEHHWLLINPDEKGWHHFDPFPTGLVLGDLTIMFNDTQAKDIARKVQAHNKTEDYYTYNKQMHPDVVQE